MKIVNPKKDFGYYEVGDEDFVELMIDKIDIDGCSNINLDLSECITNYPATSKIIDKILYQLLKLKGEKQLLINVGDEDDVIHLLNKLFFGSVFLGIQNDNELLSLKEINDVLEKKIIKRNINISIQNVEKGVNYYG
jgi:hypothetical protein